MMRDELRLSIRLLRKHPGWTTASILTLTLGLGAATLTLGVLDHVLWRPLDFPRGHELFTLYVRSGPEYSAVSYSDFLDFRAALQREGELAAFCRISATIDGGAFSQYHEGELASGAFFTVLGIAPYMGRFITASDNATAGAHPVIVLSHMLWRGSFGGDPAIVGKSVRVNGRPYAVIGVAPAGFRGAVWPTYQTAFWIPAAMAGDILGRDPGILTNRRLGIFQTVGRRYAGRSAEVLQATLDPLDASLRSFREAPYFPDTGSPWRVTVLPGNTLRLWPEYRGQVTLVVLLLGFMAVAVLAIGCANVATLLTARWMDRGDELRVRRALGATGSALARRLASDVFVLVGAGGVGAAVVVVVARPWLASLPLGVPYEVALPTDYRVVLVGLGVLVGVATLLGGLPVWRTLRTLTGLNARSSAVAGSGSRTMHAVVVTQVALATALLVGCGVLLRSASAMRDIDPGFAATNGLTALLAFTADADETPASKVTLVSRLLSRLRNDPTVVSASVSADRVLAVLPSREVRLDGMGVTPAAEARMARVNWITGGYFSSYGIPLVAGRVFVGAESDTVAIVSRDLAERWWPGRGLVIGRQLRIDGENRPRRVVGVVGDVAGPDLRGDREPTVYLPWKHRPDGWAHVNIGTRSVVGTALSTVLLTQVRSLDPSLAVTEIRTYGDLREEAYGDANVLAAMSTGLAACAVVLAVVGLYGLIGYVVGRRQHELSVRAALGASPAANAGLVLRRIGGLTAGGVVVGLVMSVVMVQGLGSLIYAVESPVWIVRAVVSGVVAVAALLSCYPHIQLAARADPVAAVRAE